MRILLTSNNVIRISFVMALLRDSGIRTVLLDEHASVTEGSAGAIPRRLMVADADYDHAKHILTEAREW